MSVRQRREILGHGKEHIVYSSRRADIVLKVPRPSILLTGLVYRAPLGQIVKDEFRRAEDLIVNTGVEIPKTRVFTFGRSYVIAQRRMNPDNSVPDPPSHTGLLGNEVLMGAYLVAPDNFVSQDGKLYLTDPTLGYMRIPYQFGLRDYRVTNRIRLIIGKALGKIGIEW